MKKFNEEKIIKVVQEAKGDITAREVCRKHPITEQALYRWRNKFDSMTVLKVRRLQELWHDNSQLKQIMVDLTLDNRILRDVNQKFGKAVGASPYRLSCDRINISSFITMHDPARWQKLMAHLAPVCRALTEGLAAKVEGDSGVVQPGAWRSARWLRCCASVCLRSLTVSTMPTNATLCARIPCSS